MGMSLCYMWGMCIGRVLLLGGEVRPRECCCGLPRDLVFGVALTSLHHI